MALFWKKAESIPEKPERPQAAPAAESQGQQSLLSSGRMATVFLKLYRWIISVNLSLDAYQVESGLNLCDGNMFPVRGRFHALMPLLSACILPEQQKQFQSLFSADSVKCALAHGRTSISGTFCARFDPADQDGSKPELCWYEVRAEWARECPPDNLLLILYFRNIRDDLDNGQLLSLGQQAEAGETPEQWADIRAKRLLGSSDAILFEYDVRDDCMYVHRLPGSKQGDRITKHFLSTLTSRGDWVISHESLAQVEKLLRSAPGRGVERGEILYRANGAFGAPYQHYRVAAVPLEEEGAPTWILGMLENVEEVTRQSRQNREIILEISKILEIFRIELYEIRCEKNQIFRIVQGPQGFRLEDTPRNLREYIQTRVDNETIAPESRQNYLDWLSPGTMNKRAGKFIWEFESCCREPGGTEYRWYSESILPLGTVPGRYLRWRSDITESHAVRERNYKLKEMTSLAEYNGTMLDSIASMVEFRNVESFSHVRNVRELTSILLNDVARRSPQYHLTQKQIALYVQAAAMHDIGKIITPDSILNKSSQFTPEEFEEMKQHTTNGALIVDRLEMPGQEELKAIIRDVVLHHHERYDGNGYPDGLAGDAIPIGVQVISLADVYDSLVSERCYKKEFSTEVALRMILDGECGIFAPYLLETLKACSAQLDALYANTKGTIDG